MNLTIRPGKEPIAVWRRGRWTSMPHAIGVIADNGSTMTRCGHIIAIFTHGVDSLVYTQITTELFLTTGCGTCRNGLMRDLHDKLMTKNPNAKNQLTDILTRLDWKSK